MVSARKGIGQYNGGTTHLLSIILERATGKKVDEFAKEYLFSPLGYNNFRMD